MMEANTSTFSEDGFPISATTDTNYKKLKDNITKKNEEILKKLANADKDENEIMGEYLEQQITDAVPNGMATKFLEMATCPCCGEYYFGYVIQCNEGHQMCENCRNRTTICPQCRKPFGQTMVRSRAFEDMLTHLDIKVPCAHKNLGCVDIIPYSKVHEHRRKCKFRPAECFYNSCKFKANDYSDYAEHLASVHRAIPTDMPDMEFFQLNISNLVTQLSGTSGYNSRQYGIFIHSYNGDYLIIHIMPSGNKYDYRVSVHSLASRYYMFSTTIQAPGALFTEQHEFRVLPIDLLKKLYTKTDNHTMFYEYYNKYFGWYSANVNYKQLEELSKYPGSTVNCMLRNPSANELQIMIQQDSVPDLKLMDNPVEDVLTQDQIDAILTVDDTLPAGGIDLVLPPLLLPPPLGPIYHDDNDDISDDDTGESE